MDETIKHFLKKNSGKKIFIIDSSAFCRFEEIQIACGKNILSIMKASSKYTFVILNTVLVELMNGPRSLDLNFFMNNIVNSEISMDPKWKENRFIIEEDGEIRYVVLNKISAVDYGQISLCQNHPEFSLVTNDEKMLKSASRIIPGRIFGPAGLLDRLLEFDPNNTDIKLIQLTALKIFSLLHPFKKS